MASQHDNLTPSSRLSPRLLRTTATFLPPLLVTLFGVLAWMGVQREHAASMRVRRSTDALNAYQQIFNVVRDAQNGARGFVITGQPSYLKYYETARLHIGDALSHLHEEIREETDTASEFGELNALVVRAFAMYARVVDTRRTRGREAAVEVIASGQGEAITDEIRDLVAQGVARERHRVRSAAEDAGNRRRYLMLLLPLGAIGAALCSYVLNAALGRYARREEETIAELKEANDRLRGQQAELEQSAVEVEEAAQALEESRNRLSALLANSHDVLTVADAERNITFASPSIERVLGFTPQEIIERRGMLQLVHPDDVGITMRFRDETAAQPRVPQSAVVRMRCRDGSYRTIHYIGVNMLDHPAIQGYVYNGRDITDQRRLEEQLLQSQKMEAIGRLAGGIAHDFNNLLTTIKGHVTFALEDTDASHPARADLEEVQAAADRAAALTRQLLVFSRQQPLEHAVINVNDVVLSFHRMIRRVIGEDIELVVRLPREPQAVHADAGQLNQVLMNLVVNARDAMPEGGSVTIEVAGERHNGAMRTLPSDCVRLSVSDTGSGIPAELQERIFEPFFTTKEKGKGTGLGLSMVYGIVKQSRGHIELTSERGKGTRFVIHLPRVDN